MNPVHLALAGMGAGVVGVCSSWLVTGMAFHPYQARTPSTWRRQEGGREYALASALTVVAALAVTALFALTGGIAALASAPWLVQGTAFGASCWAALAAPVLLSMAVFVNLHRVVVVGLLLDWLLVALVAGAAAAWAAHG
jgi:hypothetical protein